ncbi:MAG: M48 family metallopeptidase [Sedimentisphaerales bacterium]|nr:M48 family metallopeptidase [Sedimentisphaerales bacterium]
MWELIRANKRNSIFLMMLMAAVLLLLGFVIGLAIFGPEGGFFGIIIATVIWLVLSLVSFSSGDQILLAASRAQRVTHDVHPQLFNIVEEMKIAAGLPAMPKVYIINDPAPNAFATGRSPQTASVAVTAGLLARLNRDELQGVVAHEISHILHRDILYVTLAGIMLGGIVILSQVFLRGMFYSSMTGSRRRYSSGNQGGGQAQIVMLVLAILAAVLAPIMAHLLYFALSRRREYLADAGAARLTRYPEGLASALEKISSDPAPQLASANDATAPMYFVNPFKKKGKMKLSDLTSTHPPISERIRILRNMSQGASYQDYSQAYAQVTGSKSIVPAAVLKQKEQVPIREGRAEPTKAERTQRQLHQVGDIMRKVNGFAFLACTCGLNLKIPPNFKADTVQCPRCKRTLDVAAQRTAQTAKARSS